MDWSGSISLSVVHIVSDRFLSLTKMDPVYSIVLTKPNFFLKFMILSLCLLSFHLDVDKKNQYSL